MSEVVGAVLIQSASKMVGVVLQFLAVRYCIVWLGAAVQHLPLCCLLCRVPWPGGFRSPRVDPAIYRQGACVKRPYAGRAPFTALHAKCIPCMR